MKKAILVIMDGVGISPKTRGNAVFSAIKPNLDKLLAKYPNTVLEASGKAVGLPQNQMGNSEVGHLNIGAGRIVYTGLSIINNELENGQFYTNDAFAKAIAHVKSNNSKLHVMGLVSHGGVHSSFEHIVGLIKLAHKNNIKSIIHIFSDGRDVAPESIINDLNELTPILKENNAVIGTISGRYYAMDRDKNWERNIKAYDALIGESKNKFNDINEYIKDSYNKKIQDEFIVPAINGNYDAKEVAVQNNDSVIFANFRPDRARQISHLIYDSNYYDYAPAVRRNNLFFVTMMNYEGIVPSMVAYPPREIKNVFGKIIEENNLKQLRIAETEKYAHVTFFFDGGVEQNYQGEEKIIIPSPKVATYDLAPEMSANEVCRTLIERMKDFDVIIVNFANGDMVGHTGNFEATVKAVQTVDKCVGEIYDKAQEYGATLFITADHGNADEMLNDNDEVVTSHSTNVVPFIVTDSSYKLNSNGKLGNIAPTILEYLGIDKPSEMNEYSLLIKNL